MVPSVAVQLFAARVLDGATLLLALEEAWNRHQADGPRHTHTPGNAPP